MVSAGRILWPTLLLVTVNTQTWSATLTPEAGEVLLSTGGGYKLVKGPTEVAPSDCILVNPDGLAKLQLDEGAIVTIQPGQSVCVGEAAGWAPTVGEGAAGAPGAMGGASTLVIGGVAVAGAAGVVAAVASGSDSGSNGGGGGGGGPASP